MAEEEVVDDATPEDTGTDDNTDNTDNAEKKKVTPDPGVSVAKATDDGTDDGDDDGKPAVLDDDSPENWRQKYAGGDPKREKQLERYKSEQAWIDSTWEAKKKIREGGSAPVPDETSTDEEWDAYREEMGIPKTPGDYEIDLPEELRLNESDKPFIEEMVTTLHGHNIPNAVANDLARAFKDAEAQKIQSRHDMDMISAQQSMKTLKDSYGPDFKTNQNLFEHVVGQMPTEVQEQFRNARGLDGTPLIYNPAFVDSMVEMARKAYPSVTVLPNTSDPLSSAKDEIAKLEEMMGDDDWYKDSNKANRDRYMKLVSYLDRESE